jgi:hypothetical protein
MTVLAAKQMQVSSAKIYGPLACPEVALTAKKHNVQVLFVVTLE